jgi:hypothetical protein
MTSDNSIYYALARSQFVARTNHIHWLLLITLLLVPLSDLIVFRRIHQSANASQCGHDGSERVLSLSLSCPIRSKETLPLSVLYAPYVQPHSDNDLGEWLKESLLGDFLGKVTKLWDPSAR